MQKQVTSLPGPLTFWSSLALVFPLGLAPKAPGTFGSLAGIPLGLFFYTWGQDLADRISCPAWTIRIAMLLAFAVLSWWAIDRTEKLWNTHDDGRIVIDEVLGQAIPLAFVGGHGLIVLAAFGLFRFFDIVKPGPVGWLDRNLPGAWGTLLDDVLAGILAWAVIALGQALLSS